MTDRDLLFDTLRWELREVIDKISSSDRSDIEKTHLAVRLMGVLVGRFARDIAYADSAYAGQPFSIVAEHLFGMVLDNLRASERAAN